MFFTSFLAIAFAIFSALAIAVIGQLFVFFKMFDGNAARIILGDFIFYLFSPAFMFYTITKNLNLEV